VVEQPRRQAVRFSRTPLVGVLLLACMACAWSDAEAVPSFTRQTGLKCSVCQSNPPELTAFGRKFKLEGYTLTDPKADPVVADKDVTLPEISRCRRCCWPATRPPVQPSQVRKAAVLAFRRR